MLDAIYIHIPFCKKKCAYCDFLSFENMDKEIEKYVNYLLREVELYDNYKYDTIYFGGGTPSLLSPEQIKKILDRLSIKKNAEITLEVNPITVDLDKLNKFREIGINRLSIGIQSFNNQILKTLGRLHDSKKSIETFNSARQAGFANISIDLMFAVPGQDIDILLKDLEILRELNPEHVSIYSLIWEEGTKFWDMKEKNILFPVNDDLEADMFEKIIEELEKLNYIHYEISNFSKKGYEAKHNIKYWKNKEYLGIGLGASGYRGNRRYKNVCFFNDFYGKINNTELPIFEYEIIKNKKEYEYMLGLRLLKEGIEITENNKYKAICKKLVKDGYLLEYNKDKFHLTKKGLFLANDVFVEFLEGDTYE